MNDLTCLTWCSFRFARYRNPENIWLLNVLTGRGVHFPCQQCHDTLQDFIALECPELQLCMKCDESTQHRRRIATTLDLPVYDANDAHATTQDENVAGNQLLKGTRSPSDDPIYRQRHGEPFLACCLRRLQDESRQLVSSPVCKGEEIAKGGYSVGNSYAEVVNHNPKKAKIMVQDEKDHEEQAWKACFFQAVLMVDNWREVRRPQRPQATAAH